MTLLNLLKPFYNVLLSFFPLNRNYEFKTETARGAPEKVYCVVITSEDGPSMRSSFKSYIISIDNLLTMCMFLNLICVEYNYHTSLNISGLLCILHKKKLSSNAYELLDNEY